MEPRERDEDPDTARHPGELNMLRGERAENGVIERVRRKSGGIAATSPGGERSDPSERVARQE
jgi:hypothetical protein